MYRFARLLRCTAEAGARKVGALPPISVLGLGIDATEKDIKRAYHLLAKKHHPDAGGDRKRFEEIHEAYKQLEDASWNTRIGMSHTAADISGSSPNYDPTQSPAQNYVVGWEAQLVRYVAVGCIVFAFLGLIFLRKTPDEPDVGAAAVDTNLTSPPTEGTDSRTSSEQQPPTSISGQGWSMSSGDRKY